MTDHQKSPLLKATRKLYNILRKFNAIPAFRNEQLTTDLKLAELAMKEADPAYTTDIVIKGVDATIKEKIKNIAYNKGITVSRLMRPCISRILEINVMPKNSDRMEIKNVPISLKTQVEVKLNGSGKSLSGLMIEEMNRIIRETPESMHVKRL